MSEMLLFLMLWWQEPDIRQHISGAILTFGFGLTGLSAQVRAWQNHHTMMRNAWVYPPKTPVTGKYHCHLGLFGPARWTLSDLLQSNCCEYKKLFSEKKNNKKMFTRAEWLIRSPHTCWSPWGGELSARLWIECKVPCESRWSSLSS